MLELVMIAAWEPASALMSVATAEAGMSAAILVARALVSPMFMIAESIIPAAVLLCLGCGSPAKRGGS